MISTLNTLTVISGVPADIRRRERSLRQVEIKLCVAGTFNKLNANARGHGTEHQTHCWASVPPNPRRCVCVVFFSVSRRSTTIYSFLQCCRSARAGVTSDWMRSVTVSCILNPQILASPSVNLFGDTLGGRAYIKNSKLYCSVNWRLFIRELKIIVAKF